MMTNSLPTANPIPPNSPKNKKPFFWLSLFLFAVICALLVGFWQYQQVSKPKIETISRDGVISKVQTLSRLQTVAYNIDTVIKAEKQGTWQQLWTDEQKGLFVAHGRVQAGIDLTQLKPENVQVLPITPEMAAGKVPVQQQVTIALPPAQIFETYLDNVEVYDIQTGLFGAMPTDPQIFSEAQTAGKQQVLATACKSDILKLATDNAQKQVQGLFALANLVVTVNTTTPKTCS